MENQLMKYETYALRIKRLLLLAGLWPGRVFSNAFRIIIVIHAFTTFVTSLSIMNFVAAHVTNLALATRGFGIAVSFFTILLKITVFVANRDNHVRLHKTLNTIFREDLANDELRPILLSALNFFSRSTSYLTISTWAIGAVYIFSSPISISVQLARNVRPIKYRLPFPSRYPAIIDENSVLYSTQYIIEILGGCAITAISAGTDALFGFYIFQMASQFRTLSYRMANLKATDDYPAIIKMCALRHQVLSHCRDKLERIYGPIVLWMLATSAMILCANIFQASQISFDKAALVMTYMTMKLLQTLLYGWYGLILTTESEAFRESVYSSGWPGSGEKSFESSVLIMLMYKPLALSACKFSTISLDMFTAILNTALSYFFLLRTLAEKE